MSVRAVAIGLKIPDNEAYTALTTLQRLGVGVAAVERSTIVRADDGGDPDALLARLRADESLFNPNKHRLALLDADEPRAGEVWVQARDGAARCVAWRLLDAHGIPVKRSVLEDAVERLLRNPAIETAAIAP